MNHRSRPDLPPHWRSSTHPHPLQTKSQPPVPSVSVIPDPRFSLSSPPQSPPSTFHPSTSVGKKPARTHSKQSPSNEFQEDEDGEYARRPRNPYRLPPASVMAVEVGSQSQSNRSLSRISPREALGGPVIPEDDDSDVVESQATTISTFFSPDLDAGLPRTPDSDDNAGRRGPPVVQKRVVSRSAGGAIRSLPRTTRVSPMTTPTKSRFSKDTRDRESNDTSFACAGAKAVTTSSKRRNLASLLGIKSKNTKRNAPETRSTNDENTMDIDTGGALDNLKKFKARIWGDVVSDVPSWDETFFAAGGGREDRGSEEDNGPWAEYLQTVGDAMTIASTDFVMPRAAPLPPNPSLPTIPTVLSLSPLPLDDQNASVVTSTPRTKEKAIKRIKRTGRILSTGFPSPMGNHAVPTSTFGLGLEGIEMELAVAMDTNFMDVDNHRDDVHTLDADGDVYMDQSTHATPTMTTKTTVTNGKTKDKSQAMDLQRQQQPTPVESVVCLSPTSLPLKTPFGPSTRPTHSNNNLSATTTTTKPFPLPHNKQLLLTRSLSPRTPLSVSKPPAQKLMGKTIISLPSVSTTVVTPRPMPWDEYSPGTPMQQPLSPISPSPTPSPEQTPCPPERPIHVKKPTRSVYAVEKPLPQPNVAKKGNERVEEAVAMTQDGMRAGTMDEVQVCAQIDECIAATDRMEEVCILLIIKVPLILILSHPRLCALAAILTRHRLRLSVTC